LRGMGVPERCHPAAQPNDVVYRVDRVKSRKKAQKRKKKKIYRDNRIYRISGKQVWMANFLDKDVK